MPSKWLIEGPCGFVTHGADTEHGAWEQLAHLWNWADATAGFIAQFKVRGYKAVCVVDVSGIVQAVRDIEPPKTMTELREACVRDDGQGKTEDYVAGWDAAMLAVGETLNHFCEAAKKEDES